MIHYKPSHKTSLILCSSLSLGRGSPCTCLTQNIIHVTLRGLALHTGQQHILVFPAKQGLYMSKYWGGGRKQRGAKFVSC